MEDLKDCYWWEPNRKILTDCEIPVNGLRVFGYDFNRYAKKPLNLHYHKNSMELTFIVQGSQIFNIEKKEFLVAGGEVFITYMNEVHGTGGHPQGICEQYWVQFDLSDRENFLGLSPYWSDLMYYSLSHIKNRHFKIDKSYGAVLKDALYKYKSTDRFDKLQAHGSFLSFVNEVLKKSNDSHDFLSDDIKASKEYIKDNIYNEVTIEQVAQICNLSASRFKTKFCEQVGMPPIQYYNHLRLKEAKKLLEKGNGITDVAYLLHFSSSSHFSNFFKKHTSMSPKQYVKECVKRK